MFDYFLLEACVAIHALQSLIICLASYTLSSSMYAIYLLDTFLS